MPPNGARDRDEVLLNTKKLSFCRLGGRDHLLDVFSSQLDPKRDGFGRDRSDSFVMGKFKSGNLPSRKPRFLSTSPNPERAKKVISETGVFKVGEK